MPPVSAAQGVSVEVDAAAPLTEEERARFAAWGESPEAMQAL